MCNLSTVKDVVTIVAGLSGITVALIGLSTWKRQLRGGQRHEIARKLMKSVLLIREELRSFRNPFISAGEIAAAMASQGDSTPASGPTSHAGFERAVYAARWKPVVEAATEFRVASLEAEAMFGSEAVAVVEGLQKLLSELGVAVSEFLRYSEPGRPLTAITAKIKEDYRAKVQAPTADDDFGNRVAGAIAEIEEFSRKYLAA